MPLLLETDMPRRFARGKVRDTFDLGDRLLMVATDRISAFDVVLPTGIPDKGAVLNLLSAFWFEKTAHLMRNHFLRLPEKGDSELEALFPSLPEDLPHRAMVVRKAQPLKVECVVRGYLAGSAWDEYRQSGTVSGHKLPEGLEQSARLPEPMFTPTTKAEPPAHDEPISLEQMGEMFGADAARQIAACSLRLYSFAADYALQRGFIIADTKFEFGWVDGELTLIDEAFTPDSSRFWDSATYEVGRSQDSFDKQPVRDWLTASGWNREPPAPELPPEVVTATTARYREAYRRLTGRELG